MSGQWTVDGWHDQDGWSTATGEFSQTIVNADELMMGQNLPSSLGTMSTSSAKMAFFYDQGEPTAVKKQTLEDDEPPLLEELGIEPEEIAKKVMVVLNPFNSSVPLGDYDLAGPLFFCLALAVTMLFSGGKVNFSFVYSFALLSCILMYALLWVMTTGHITMASVASVLGYSLLPILGLSAISIFVTLRTYFGYSLALVAIFWASLTASRVFVAMSTDQSQRPLIAYPCALLYAVLTLLVIF